MSEDGFDGFEDQCTQSRSVIDASAEVKEELLRKASIKLASDASALARQEGVTELQHATMMEELERDANQKRADRMVEEERLRILNEEAAKEASDMAEREATRVQVTRDVEEERKRQEIRGVPTNEPFFERICRVANDLIRSQNQKAVDLMVMEEQQYRVLENAKRDCLEQLERVVNQRIADKEVSEEAKRRNCVEQHESVMEELTRRHARFLVLEQEAEEQRRRVIANSDFPFGNRTEQRARLNEDIISLVNRRVASELCKAEQEGRVMMDRYSTVLQQLDRTFNQKCADEQVHDEQESAITKHYFEDRVLPDVAATGRLRENLRQVEATRESQVASENDTIHRRQENSALLETLAEIERIGNRKSADRLMDEEKENRCIMRQKENVMRQLERFVAGQQANNLAKDEAARIAHSVLKSRMEEQLLGRQRLLEILHDVETERASQIQNAPPSRPVVFAELMEQIERLGNQAQVDRDMDLEQERQVLIRKATQVHDDLMRKVRQAHVARKVKMEQIRRVALANNERLRLELERHFNQKYADKACDEEQRRRLQQEHTELSKIILEQREELLSDIERLGNRRDADEMMQLEQERRVIASKLDHVLEQLVHKLDCLRVDSAADEERTRRITLANSTVVLEELLRNSRAREVDAQCEAERCLRVRDADVMRNRRSDFKGLYDLLTEVERHANQKRASKAEDLERKRRVLEEQFARVMLQLRRQADQHDADLAMDIEKAQRCTVELFALVRNELQRRVVREQVTRLADQERIERIQYLAENQSLFEKDPRYLVNEQLLRSQNWKASERLIHDEKEYYRQVDRATLLHEDLLRRANQDLVDQAIALERARIVHLQNTAAVHEQLLSTHRWNVIVSQIAADQEERVKNSGTSALRFAGLSRQWLLQVADARKSLRKVESPSDKAHNATEYEDACEQIRLRQRILHEMDVERRDRVMNHKQLEALAELERKKSHVDVRLAMEEEKRRRIIDADEMRNRETDEREFNQRVAIYLADTERRSRMSERIPFHSRPRPLYMDEILGSDGEYTFVDSVLDREPSGSPQPQSPLAGHPQDDLEDLMESWRADLERRQQKRYALALEELARMERMHELARTELHARLEEETAANMVDMMADNEQQRRIDEVRCEAKCNDETRKFTKEYVLKHEEEERRRLLTQETTNRKVDASLLRNVAKAQ